MKLSLGFLKGTVNFQTWEKVGKQLHDGYAAEGPEKIPISILTLWSLAGDGLDPARESLRTSKRAVATALQPTAEGCESLKTPPPPLRLRRLAVQTAVQSPPDKDLPPNHERQLESEAERASVPVGADSEDRKGFAHGCPAFTAGCRRLAESESDLTFHFAGGSNYLYWAEPSRKD